MIAVRKGETEQEYLRRLFAFVEDTNTMIDQTLIGPQYVLEGCERVSDKTLAERRWSAPKRSTKSQNDAAGPLFGDDALQVDLVDMARRR